MEKPFSKKAARVVDETVDGAVAGRLCGEYCQRTRDPQVEAGRGR